MKTTFKLLLLSLLCLVLPLLSGCGNGSSALVGRWLVDEEQWQASGVKEFALFKDGTGIIVSSSDHKTSVTWKVTDNRFYLTSPEQTRESDYKISGSTLTLTPQDGHPSLVLKKQK